MANRCVARMHGLTKSCVCGAENVDLWTDTGTNEFWLQCDNQNCEMNSTIYDLDIVEKLWGLYPVWEGIDE